MGIETVAAVVGVVSTVASTVGSISSAGKTASAQKRRLKLQEQQQRLEANREKSRIHRENRLRRAAIVNNATIQGAGASSAAAGAVQGSISTTRADTGYVNVNQLLATKSNEITREQINLNRQNTVFDSITSGVTGTLRNASQIDFDSIFGG